MSQNQDTEYISNKIKGVEKNKDGKLHSQLCYITTFLIKMQNHLVFFLCNFAKLNFRKRMEINGVLLFLHSLGQDHTYSEKNYVVLKKFKKFWFIHQTCLSSRDITRRVFWCRKREKKQKYVILVNVAMQPNLTHYKLTNLSFKKPKWSFNAVRTPTLKPEIIKQFQCLNCSHFSFKSWSVLSGHSCVLFIFLRIMSIWDKFKHVEYLLCFSKTALYGGTVAKMSPSFKISNEKIYMP